MSRLNFGKGFKPEDLINGVEFEIDPEGNLSDDSDDFYDERFDEFKENNDYDHDTKPVEWNVPFDELQDFMTPLTEDGGIRKQMIKPGTGIVVPEKCIVIMHYDAFVENQELPFDSTRLRNKPHKVLLNDGNLIPGLELSVQTMKKEELSRFLVTSDYAYGEMGCPPRIPGNARILYIVELLNFFESKDAVEFDEMTPEEQKKASFERIVTVFHCEHQIANDMFRIKHFKPAIARYRKMVRLLEDVSVANEEEDKQRNGYLLKLYLNLCLSYTKIHNSRKAIIYGNLALNLDEKNPKAMYRLGCAYLLADEFSKAKHYLLKAKQHEPYALSVHNALVELQKKEKQHRDWENVFCKRMFDNISIEKSSYTESFDTKEFRSILEKKIKKFVDSEEKELAFSSGYTDWQIEIAKECASKHNLAFVSKIHDDTKILKAVKT